MFPTPVLYVSVRNLRIIYQPEIIAQSFAVGTRSNRVKKANILVVIAITHTKVRTSVALSQQSC